MPTFRSTRKSKKCDESVPLFDHKVLHNIASSSSCFRFCSDFLAFFARIVYFKFLECKEFNKTIIPFALVGYETDYSQLGATRLVGYLPSHIQHTLMELIVNYAIEWLHWVWAVQFKRDEPKVKRNHSQKWLSDITTIEQPLVLCLAFTPKQDYNFICL